MATLFIGIPMGETVRNVLRTETFSILRSTPGIEIVILSQGYADSEFRREFEDSNVCFEPLYDYSPKVIERIMQSLRVRMLRPKSRTVAISTEAEKGIGRKILTKLIDGFIRFAGDERIHRVLRLIDLSLPSANSYKDVFQKHRPDIVIVTRVMNLSADSPLLRQAAKLKIPVVALVASWDNLTSKAFFPFALDSLVVWNDIMRREAIELFNFPEEKIFVSGVPRFDSYFRRENMRSRSEFFKDYDLDPDKKLVTYTTSHDRLFWPHEATSPEPEIVKFLARAIQSDELGAPSQLLVRLHPQASRKLYEQLAKEEGVTLQVPGRPSRFQDRDLSVAEGVLLGETMLHSDVVVNVASTITIDASIFGTPVVCIGFDMRGERPYLTSVRRFYDFDHYKKLARTSGFRIAARKEDLVTEVHHYLADPTRDREGRQKIVEEQCYYVDGRSAERVAHHIQNLLGIRNYSVSPYSNSPSVNPTSQPSSAGVVRS
jgi:hypothetical protein